MKSASDKISFNLEKFNIAIPMRLSEGMNAKFIILGVELGILNIYGIHRLFQKY